MFCARGLIVCLVIGAVSGSADALCIIQLKSAGPDAAYLYVANQIDGLLNADDALTRMYKVSTILKRPNDPGMANVAEALTTLEVAARGFECAASVTKTENFHIAAPNDFARGQSELAESFTAAANATYTQLAGDARTLGVLLQRQMKGSIDQIDLAAAMSQVSANLQERLKTIMTIASGLSHLLVDPVPDASGHMSRLQITERERIDLINMLDKWFGFRARSNTKTDLPPLDAGVTLLRQWLATSGHTTKH
jgi:hypothetical protein